MSIPFKLPASVQADSDLADQLQLAEIARKSQQGSTAKKAPPVRRTFLSWIGNTYPTRGRRHPVATRHWGIVMTKVPMHRGRGRPRSPAYLFDLAKWVNRAGELPRKSLRQFYEHTDYGLFDLLQRHGVIGADVTWWDELTVQEKFSIEKRLNHQWHLVGEIAKSLRNTLPIRQQSRLNPWQAQIKPLSGR